MPVGLKNSTDGSLQVAIDAMGATRHPHSFLGINEDGVTSIVRTSGNPHAHVVLRGGRANDQLRRGKHPRGGTKTDLRKIAADFDGGLQPCELQQTIRETGRRLAQRHRTAGRRNPIAHRADGGKPFARRQPADLEKCGRFEIRREHHRFCIGWETTERMLTWGYETLGKTIKAPIVSTV